MTTDGTTVGFFSPETVARARAALVTEGAILIANAGSADYCREVKGWIDANQAPGDREQFYKNTELRIWDNGEHHAILEPFRKESDKFVSELTNSSSAAYAVLAIRNNQIPANDPTVEMGRWHIDSFKKQVKVFLFVTDTTVESGAFEYIPGTQSGRFKTLMALRGIYFKPSDFFAKTRSYAKLPDPVIDRLAEKGYLAKPVLVKAGTAMVVDTSAIHRARPCRQGARYALTAYYR